MIRLHYIGDFVPLPRPLFFPHDQVSPLIAVVLLGHGTVNR